MNSEDGIDDDMEERVKKTHKNSMKSINLKFCVCVFLLRQFTASIRLKLKPIHQIVRTLWHFLWPARLPTCTHTKKETRNIRKT